MDCVRTGEVSTFQPYNDTVEGANVTATEEPSAQRKEPNSEHEIMMRLLAIMERRDNMLERLLIVSQSIELQRLTCNAIRRTTRRNR